VPTHRPFEDWILEEASLPPEAARLLRKHLQGCADCRRLADGWDVARRKLNQPPAMSPRPGFAGRWLRLQVSQGRPRRAGLWSLVVVSLGASLAAAGFIAWALASALSSPSVILQMWIRQLVTWSLWVRVGGDILEVASGTLPLHLVAGLGLALALAWAGLIAVWLVSLRRIAFQGVSS